MALDNPDLKDVLKDVASGVLQLPDFQRDWKWDDERIRALIATVTLKYPLGVVMALHTGGASPFKARTLEGAKGGEGRTPDLLLLDGQQRLTSLFQALHQDGPVETRDGRGKDLRRWYYVDIAKAVGTPADRDDAIVSVPEDKVLKRDFARTVVLDLTTTERECAAGYFPLHFVFDTHRVGAWQQEFVRNPENWPLWMKFQEQVLNNMLSFDVPMIKLAATTTTDAVCAVFERVNSGGVPLNVFELLTASYAGDQEHVAAHGDYYRLPDEWRAIKQVLTSAYPVLGRAESGPEDGLSSSDFLQAVSLVRTWEAKQAGSGTAVSCKRRDLLNLPLADFRRLAPRVAAAFGWVGGFLERQAIARTADLPYRTQLVPLAAVRALLGAGTDTPAAEERIAQWYWCGVLGEMYGGSLETRFTRDVEQLIDWIRDEHAPQPDTVTEAAFLEDRLDTLSTRNSAAYKGIYALLIKQGAVDWHYTEEPLTPGQLVERAVDVRLIYPKPWITRNLAAWPANVNWTARASSIVNKTPLSLRAAKSMTGPPAAYLKTLSLESGMRPEWFEDVLATHLVDVDALREDDFVRFYETRAKSLLDLVMSAMGKRTVVRDTAEW
ncbi:GmrSD restriction endonuclease domain-containing protein [Streptomyces hydrogenans]|uniref:GmrSD restriction endonuclease domain-containing protein n=1 Tax=Streptomyces hydrogenans TaxID=1873719 RepID=UPI00331AC9F7